MWFRWLVPSTAPTPPPVPTTNVLRTRRRRSVPLPSPVGSLSSPIRRVTAPISPSFLEDDVALHHSKHVYFLDPGLPNTRSESFVRETDFVLVEGESLDQPETQLQPLVDGSPQSSLSSSSTLVSNSIQVQMNVDPGDEPPVESDSSSRRSLSMRLPKMKNPFVGRARRRSANAETFSKARLAGV
jgi:hypothetical protein